MQLSYRLVRSKSKYSNFRHVIGIHEVFHEDGKIMNFCVNPVTLSTPDDCGNFLEFTMKNMSIAFAYPIIDIEDLEKLIIENRKRK